MVSAETSPGRLGPSFGRIFTTLRTVPLGWVDIVALSAAHARIAPAADQEEIVSPFARRP
jgi:hypothetical protein